MRFKVIIIHPDQRMSKIIAERLTAYGCIVQAFGSTAEEAYRLCHDVTADAIFMAAKLPDGCCDNVTATLEQEITRPLLKIALAESENHTLSNRFYNYCGDLFLAGPVDYVNCMDQMWQYYRLRLHQGTPINPSPEVRGCARKYLMRMQMPPNVRGFTYLLDAVELVIQQPALQNNLVQGLYTKVGAIHEEPFSNIERCIRSAVEKTFEYGDLSYIYKHFGKKVCPQTGKTKNGDFIDILSTMVRDDLKTRY